MFNRLISERKLLAAFYSSIVASTLLAGLALSSDRWQHVDSSSRADLSRLTCELSARASSSPERSSPAAELAHSRRNRSAAAFLNWSLRNGTAHDALVEKVSIDADSGNAVRHPPDRYNGFGDVPMAVRFEQMQLHSLEIAYRTHRNEDMRSALWTGCQGLNDLYVRFFSHGRRTDRIAERAPDAASSASSP